MKAQLYFAYIAYRPEYSAERQPFDLEKRY